MSQWDYKRKDPYTAQGIKRIKCIRCGKPAEHQWQICSDDGNFRAICIQCDIELNALVLKFMKHPRAAQLIAKYTANIN